MNLAEIRFFLYLLILKNRFLFFINNFTPNVSYILAILSGEIIVLPLTFWTAGSGPRVVCRRRILYIIQRAIRASPGTSRRTSLARLILRTIWLRFWAVGQRSKDWGRRTNMREIW